MNSLKRPAALWLALTCAALLNGAAAAAADLLVPSTNAIPGYEFRPGSFDGIGKWFMGREIAHYMSHQGAMWLEREEREEEEQPNELIRLLDLKPGQTVADIGAGSGYFSWRMARQVGPSGRVFANDLQPEMLGILRTNMSARHVTNVVAVQGSSNNVNLPSASLDLALLVDVYHECDHPREVIASLCEALKDGGRLVLVEYRGEDRWIPIKPLHKMTAEQVARELAIHPLAPAGAQRLSRQHVLTFRRSPRN
jgi:ubiquinone/menaquinone biosynthesis C-methylase UbiE